MRVLQVKTALHGSAFRVPQCGTRDYMRGSAELIINGHGSKRESMSLEKYLIKTSSSCGLIKVALVFCKLGMWKVALYIQPRYNESN